MKLLHSVLFASFLGAGIVLAGLAPAAAQTPPAPAPAPSDYDKFMKDADKQSGLFTIWRKDGKLYLELREDQLEKDYLEHIVPANGLGGFGFHSGQQFAQSARLLRFHRDGKQVAMIWPHTRFISQPGTPLATAVRESTADSVEALLPIATENKASKAIVLDISPLLGDLLDLGNQLSRNVENRANPQGAYALDPTRTYFGPTKAFAKNIIVEADQTFRSAKPDTVNTVPDARFIQMRVKYNFSEILSSPDYMPRLYDDRVGFWEDAHVAFDNDNTRNNNLYYILRWNVQPSDPSQKLSPPKKPIVFYLDNSIPTEYRATVRQGVIEWNKAFERIGIKDALQVLDPPNDPSWDPDDIRYSVIRWVTDAESQFGAQAQIVWDPRTGEIFRGGVLLDSNLARFAKFSEKYLQVSMGGPEINDRIVQEIPHESFAPSHDESAFAAGKMADAAFGQAALTLMGGEGMSLDEYTRQRILDVTLHEVGHDFGLSHNFIGHNAFTSAQLKDRNFTLANGVSSSVMDYSPINIWPKGVSKGTYFGLALGPYDYHVVHWGYAPVPGAKRPQDEIPTLNRWASAATDPRFTFAGDEDGQFNGHAVDPRSAPFVLTNEPIAWCGTQMDFYKHLLNTIDSKFPQAQTPWSEERSAFLAILGRYSTCAFTMAHYIAGEHLSRGRIGDRGVDTAFSPVPRSQELTAYRMLDKYVFSSEAWQIAPRTLNRLAYTEYIPFSNFGYKPEARHDVAVVDLIGRLQNRALGYMYSPLVLQRLADLPLKSKPGETMTLSDLFTWNQSAIYHDLGTTGGSNAQLRRNLQRRYTRLLADLIVNPAPGTPFDAQALARLELTSLKETIHSRLARGVGDLQTKAHLISMQTDIAEALEAKTVVPATRTAGDISFH